MMYNNEDLGIVVLASDHNPVRLAMTKRSIDHLYHGEVQTYCVTDKGIDESTLAEMRKTCPVQVGGETYTSLINTAMGSFNRPWKLFIMEGIILRWNIARKIFKFVKNNNDIAYSVTCAIDRRNKIAKTFHLFHESSLNGLTIHNDIFKSIGEFNDDELIPSRLNWATRAKIAEARLIGIHGIRF